MPYEDTDWTTADDTAKDTAQHFFTDTSGAHVTENADAPDTGNNVLIDSNGMYVRSGTDVLAEFGQDVTIRDAGSNRELVMTGTGFDIRQINGVAGFHIDCYPAVQLTNIWAVGKLIIGGTPVELQGSNVTIDTTGSGGNGDITVKTAGNIVISDGTNALWSGTAQQLADALSGSAASGPKVYAGSVVKTASGTNCQLWTKAAFESTFHTTNAQLCGVMISNGDAGSLSAVVSAEYWSSGSNPGWFAKWTNSVGSGGRRFNYIVVVPEAYQA